MTLRRAPFATRSSQKLSTLLAFYHAVILSVTLVSKNLFEIGDMWFVQNAGRSIVLEHSRRINMS